MLLAGLVVVEAKLLVGSPQAQELLDKGFLEELALILETTVAEVGAVLVVLVEHVTQKLQDMVAQVHLTLYQDHYNIMQAVVEQA